MIFLKSLTTIKVNHSESHIKQKQVLSSSVSLFWLRQNRNCPPTCDYSRLPSIAQVPFCLKILEQMQHSSDWVWLLLVILHPSAAFNLVNTVFTDLQQNHRLSSPLLTLWFPLSGIFRRRLPGIFLTIVLFFSLVLFQEYGKCFLTTRQRMYKFCTSSCSEQKTKATFQFKLQLRDSVFLLKREGGKERLIHFYYPPPRKDAFHSDVIKL